MIKLEMHLHSKGGSSCAKQEPEDIIKLYKEYGYGAIVLTNHYCYDAFKDYPGKDKKEKLDYYFKLFDKMKTEGEKNGIKIFLGAEVRTLEKNPDDFSEYLLYGFDRNFFYDNKELFLLSQKELFKLCDNKGIYMGESHPFRSFVIQGDPNYMHGAERFNGHVAHENRNDLAEEFVKKYNLIGTSGTDYHDTRQVPVGGIYITEDVKDERDLANYLFKNDFKIIKN